jgi:hypothetical protein
MPRMSTRTRISWQSISNDFYRASLMATQRSRPWAKNKLDRLKLHLALIEWDISAPRERVNSSLKDNSGGIHGSKREREKNKSVQ